MNSSPTPSSNPVLVQAWRGGIVESAHRGAFAVVDAGGRVVASLGDIERPIFPRSAVKVLQALPLVASGAADALRLSDEELALACASHGGEEAHARTAASMLAKAGVDAGALECGAHWPSNEQAARTLARQEQSPGALHNNCSGKHAGFVCLGCRLHGGRGDLRGFLAGYVKPGHPVMREVSAAIQAATGWDLARSARGTDAARSPPTRCRCATWRWPSRAWPAARAWRPTMRGPRCGCAGRWRARPSWWPAPAASTPA